MTSEDARAFVDHRAVGDLISAFQLAFDSHNWSQLRRCLAEVLDQDYSGLRMRPRRSCSADDYVTERRVALDHLVLQHNHSNLVVVVAGDQGTATCNFVIYRFEADGPRSFHSWGRYRFGLARHDGVWRIASIEQHIARNEGDPALHHGVPRDAC